VDIDLKIKDTEVERELFGKRKDTSRRVEEDTAKYITYMYKNDEIYV
jgi:hypothetical protein